MGSSEKKSWLNIFSILILCLKSDLCTSGKYTHKTLSRVLENMPAVSDLTSCRLNYSVI